MEKRLSIYFFLAWITSIFSVFSFGETSITMLLFLPFVALIRKTNKFKFNRHIPVAIILLLISIFLGFLIAVIAQVNSSTITHLIQSILCLLTFIAFSSLNSKIFFPIFAQFSYYFVMIVSVYGIYQFAARKYGLPFDFLPITNLQIADDLGYQRGFGKLFNDNQLFTRVSSFFAESSDLGRFLLIIYPWSLYYKRRIFLLFLVIVNIILSQSIGTIFVGIIGAIVWYSVNYNFFKDLKRLVYPIIIIISISYLILHTGNDDFNSLGRLSKISYLGWDYLSTTERFQDTQFIIEIIAKKPILGYGLGSISDFTSSLVVSNLFFLILIEKGILGLTLFLIFLLYPLLKIKKRNNYFPLISFIVIIQFLFLFNFSLLYFMPMYALAGLTYSVLVGNEKPSNSYH